MTDTTDRELLELAAKAGGILTESWYDNDAYFDGVLSRWNPLTDDGDALRLAVLLELSMSQFHSTVTVGPVGIPGVGPINERVIDNDRSRSKATRRAITRAAAEIGRKMG